jgi:transposase
MSTTTRRRFTAAFKTKVCLEALKERETIEVLAKKFDIHPNQINSWKREFIQKSESVFDKDSDHGSVSKDKLMETLYSRIGEWSVANDFLKKNYCKYVFSAKSHD